MQHLISVCASAIRGGFVGRSNLLILPAIIISVFVFSAAASTALAVSPPLTIFNDGFETGDFTNWTSDNGNWNVISGGGHTGSDKATVIGNTGAADDELIKNISTAGYGTITLSYWYKIEQKLESSDHVYAEWSTNGTSWTEIAHHSNLSVISTWVNVNVALPAGAADNANFRFRFRADLDAGNDEFRLDDVVLSGYDIEKPVIAANGNVNSVADAFGGATVSYGLPAVTDNIDSGLVATCLPASGSFFAIGTTTVTCNATDVAGNTAISTNFSVVVAVGPVDADASTLVWNNEGASITTNGGTATFTITAKDAYGNVIPNASAVLQSSGTNNTFTPPNPQLTGSNGQAQIGLQSTVAEAKTVSVQVNGVTLADSSEVTFDPGVAAKGIISASDATPEANLEGTTIDLTITITDASNNPVQDNTSVALQASSGGVLGGSGNTVNGVIERTLTFVGKGSVTLSFSGLAASGDTVINFDDTTAPVIAEHGDETAEATGYAGAEVAYVLPEAVDNIDGPVAVVCNPVSSSTFALGDTTVNCSAFDAESNEGTSSLTVHVVDTQNPTITAPSDIIDYEATANLSLITLGAPVVSDIADADLDITNDAPVAGFPVGTTMVTWTATDGSGNSATAVQIVTVIDTTVPTIDAFGPFVGNEAAADPTLGAVVTFDHPMSHDLVDGDLPADCSPASGSTFYLGETEVVCSKTDSSGNSAVMVTSTVVVIDTTAPEFSLVSPETGDLIKADFSISYTLSEALISGAIELNSDPAFTYTLSGNELAIGAHVISSASLISAGVDLSDGTHSITWSGTDMSDNSGSLTNTGIVYDETAPTALNVDSVQADGTYTVGTIIPIDVEFSETVLVEGEPQLQLAVGDARYAVYAGSSDPDDSGDEPLASLQNIRQVTDSAADESAADVAERSGVVHRVYVRDSNIYYSNSAGVSEELVGAGSSPSVAVGPNGVAQVAYSTGGNVVFATRSDWNATSVIGPNGSWGGPSLDVDGDNVAHLAFTYDSDGGGYPDIVYSNNAGGAFSAPSNVMDSSYRSYHSNPVLKTDNDGKYHILGNYHGMSCGWSCDHWYSVDYVTNAGSGFSSSGANGTLGKDSLVINSANQPRIAYNSGGIIYADPSTATWTTVSLGTGSSPSIAANSTKVGITYDDGGVKFVKDEGDGFTAPELIDASGSNQGLAMGEYAYAYYLKAGNSGAQDIFFATDKPESSGSGTTLTFNYSVQAGDLSSDLDYVATDSLQLNGGTIKDLAGNDAVLDLAVPGEAGSLSAVKGIIIDAVAPVIASHDDVTAEAVDADGSIVTYETPAAEDVYDGAVAVDCTPASGGQFAIGTTTITCTAADNIGNSDSSNFNVIVRDTTAPEITVPDDVSVVANGFNSSVDTGTATATDAVDAEPTITSDQPDLFPIGLSVVTWTACDDYDNCSTDTQNVTVVPGPIEKFTVTGDSPLTTAETSEITVYGRDHWDHVVTNDSATQVVLSADNGGALAGTLLTLTEGVAITQLTKSSAGTVNVTVMSGSLTPATTQVVFTPVDVEGPYVVSLSPENNSTGVAVSAPLFAIFNEPLDADTVNYDNFVLVKVGEDDPEVDGDGVDSLVAGRVLVEGGSKVYFMPDAALDYSTQYYFSVKSGIMDRIGNNLVAEKNKENNVFTTAANEADLTAPTVEGQSPQADAIDVELDANPYIDFSEAMNASTLTAESVRLLRTSDSSVIASTVTVANGGTRAIINPDANLDVSTAYYISVSVGVTDAAGNPLADEYNSGSFTTIEDGTILEVTGISAVRSYAEANGEWASGWLWAFDVTAPTNETSLRMKFDDFVSGANIIPAASNIRFYSAQSADAASGEEAIVIDEAGAYSPFMNLTGDLDSSVLGRQLRIMVEVRVPEGSAGGSYSTGYGIDTRAEDR